MGVLIDSNSQYVRRIFGLCWLGESLTKCCSTPPMDVPDASLIIASGTSYAECDKRVASASFALQDSNACELLSVQTIDSLSFIFPCNMAFNGLII